MHYIWVTLSAGAVVQCTLVRCLKCDTHRMLSSSAFSSTLLLLYCLLYPLPAPMPSVDHKSAMMGHVLRSGVPHTVPILYPHMYQLVRGMQPLSVATTTCI